jgi:hypothetical protein
VEDAEKDPSPENVKKVKLTKVAPKVKAKVEAVEPAPAVVSKTLIKKAPVL